VHRGPGRLPGAQLIAAGITLRPEAAEDEAFLRRLYFAVRAGDFGLLGLPEDALQQFIGHQFAIQRAQFVQRREDSDWWIVERDGAPIGRLYVLHQPDHDYLTDIALLPEMQGQGIGGALVERVQADAAARGVGVKLHVDPFRPARRLYLARGFRELVLEGADILMAWEPERSS